MDASDYRRRCLAVAEAFAAAFRPYVWERLAAFVADSSGLDAAVTTAEATLAEELGAWAETAARQQRASPLEIFREALALPTAAALEEGATPAVRTTPEHETLPGDLFGIAPATSQDLGEVAWRAHVAWGLARAEVVAGMVPQPGPAPVGSSVALIGSDLMDRSKVEAAARAAGFELLVWRNPAAVAAGLERGAPDLAFVDLEHPAARDAIRRLAARGVRTIAFGPHVDEHALAAAGALGAHEVLPRSRFFKRLPDLFPTAV